MIIEILISVISIVILSIIYLYINKKTITDDDYESYLEKEFSTNFITINSHPKIRV